MFLRLTLICMLLLLNSACATIGKEFSSSQVSLLRIGETSQAQVRSMFGAPWRVGIENGQRTWTYGHYQYSLFNQGSTEDLVVRFDNRGIVASYVFNTTKHKEGAPVTGQ